LLCKLGEGSFGEVFLAEDREHDRRIAIKLHRGELDSPGLDRFLQEGRALSQLCSRYIVHLYEVGTFANRPALILEYIAGETLERFLFRKRRLRQQVEWCQALGLLCDLAEALAVAHSAVAGPIVHRDIKPSNIMVVSSPVGSLYAKLLDFGVARVGTGQMTVEEERLGTLEYMAPEQASGNVQQIGPAVDVFALGVVGIEMLTLSPVATGRPPQLFRSRNGACFRSQLQQLRADVPEAVWDVLLRATSVDLQARYPDGLALHEALQSALESAPARQPANGTVTALSPTVRRCGGLRYRLWEMAARLLPLLRRGR
jgi:serine/threonine-protein kinase